MDNLGIMLCIYRQRDHIHQPGQANRVTVGRVLTQSMSTPSETVLKTT